MALHLVELLEMLGTNISVLVHNNLTLVMRLYQILLIKIHIYLQLPVSQQTSIVGDNWISMPRDASLAM